MGYLKSILYVLIIAASTVWVDRLGSQFSPQFLLLGTSIFATVFFNIARIKQFKQNHLTIMKAPWLWLLLSTSLAATWWFTYYGAIHASARMLLSVMFISIAMFGCILEKKILRTIACIITLAAIYKVVPEANPINMIICVLAGATGYIYFKTSKVYTDKFSITPMDVLAIRFYLLILSSAIAVIFFDMSSVNHIASLTSILFTLIVLGLFNLVLPNYFSQSGLTSLGVFKFSLITSFLPFVTFFVQYAFFGEWSVAMMLVCLLASIVLIAPLIFTNLKKRMAGLGLYLSANK